MAIFRQQNARYDELVGLGRQGQDARWAEEALVVREDVDLFVLAPRCDKVFSIGAEVQAIERLRDRGSGDLVERLGLDGDDLVLSVSAVENCQIVAARMGQQMDREIP